MSESKSKRGPGRPRKTPLKAPAVKRGIVDTPDNETNLVEFAYGMPGTFKKFAAYWKALNAEKVGFLFMPGQLIMYTKEYKENTYVRHRISGTQAISYYCAEHIEVTLSQKDVDLILQKLDKECYTISIFMSTKNRNRILNFHITTEWGIPAIFDIEVIMDPAFHRQFDGIFNEDVPYPIHVKLPSKYLKNAVADAKSWEDRWSIDYYKIPGQQLKFPYKSSNGHVRGRDIPSPEMIIVDDVKPGMYFSVSMYANVVKPTTQAMLADDIIIRAADDGRMIWMVLNVDGGAVPTDVLVKIVDLRKPTSTSESKEPVA